MRIGFDAKRIFHNTTGLGNYGRNLLKILEKHTKTHSLLLYNPKKGKIDFSFSSKKINVQYPTKYWRFFSSYWRQKPISKQLKKDNINLFHGLSGEIPRDLKIPSVVTIHDLIFFRFPKLYKKVDVWIHKKKVQYAAKNSQHIIAMSQQTKNDIIRFLNIDPNKISVIYQGCNPIFKTAIPEKKLTEIRKKLGLPQKFILTVGTIEKRKNILLILKAIKNTSFKLVVVGKPTSYKKTLNHYIAENNLRNRVIFLEKLPLETLAALYQLATVFCYPSLFEGFGIPIIESLYSKTPVITSAGGCFQEVGGPASLYINPNDEKKLTEMLQLLFTNKPLYKKIINQSWDFVQKFNDEKIAKSYLEVYEKVLKHF